MNTIYKNSFDEIIDIKSVENKYFDNWRIKDIAIFHKCSVPQIAKIIRLKIKSRRTLVYKWKVDHSFFNKIDTEEKAYILGFLCADGCVSKNKNHVGISIQGRDLDVIEKLKFHLKSDVPIKHRIYKEKEYVSIGISSKELCNDLKKWGCVPLKSSRLKWIDKIKDELLCHFVRGYCDGDGHVGFWFYKGKYLKSTVSFTSTEDFCTGLRNLFLSKLGITCYTSQRHKKIRPNSNNRTIEISGNKQNLKILNWMYSGSSIFMNRKKKKFDEFIKTYEQKL